MSTSILYHGFGIRGYRYKRTYFAEGDLVFSIEKDPSTLRCPCCKGWHVIRHGAALRWFRAVPIGRKSIYIALRVPRVECLSCGIVRQIDIGFADPRRTYTKAFERYVLELSRHMTIRDVARHLGISWDMVKDIQKRYLSKQYSQPRLRDLKLIAIDEISIGRGHRYLTVVLDLSSGAVVFVGDGKGADALIPFWKKLKCSKAQIDAVAMDMSPSYISAVSTNLPKAAIVFDHFHIIKMFNDKLAELRRELQREAEDADKQVLKGTRWLLLKNPENLRADRNERERLDAALKLNKPLATAYYLKEDLRQLWLQKDQEKAAVFLDDWIAQARSAGIKMLDNFADTLESHRAGILAYYEYPISTGPLEGTNNKIKTLQKQAYGFRDMEFFKLKIYALHETKYALVG
ncbi:MAG: ISL3 family transposase [Desulfobulbaceae bacterium]|nr:ISL3 family transposase [Desulfobulbaceae bacterium]